MGEIIHSALEKKRDGAIVPRDGCWNARTADPHDDVKAIRISRRQEKKNNLRQNKNKRRRNITLSSSDLERELFYTPKALLDLGHRTIPREASTHALDQHASCVDVV